MTGVGSNEFTTKFPNGLLIVLQTTANFSLTDPVTLPMRDNLFNIATVEGITNIAGTYNIEYQCVDVFGITVHDTYDTQMSVQQPGNLDTITWQQVVAATPTTTTLDAAPASPVQAGTSVTLTANVTPAGATGDVQFQNNGTDFGSPVAVAGGQAVLTTTSLPVGTNSLTAVFTGTGGFESSTSAPVSYQVTPGATVTSTSLGVSGGQFEGQPINYTATVTPSGAVGSVQFKEGGTTFATVPVTGGQATFSEPTGRPAGSYNFSASFVPDDPTQFTASDSLTVPRTVSPPAGSNQATEEIQVEIPAGALTITVENNNPVVLATAELNPAATRFVSPLSAPTNRLNPVTVTDTRAGNAGWTVSGQATAFDNGAGGAINAGNLGWDPDVVDFNPGQTVNAGAIVPAGDGLPVGDTSGAGLAASRTLASSPAGSSLGTAHLTASLELIAPTTTVAGTYTSILTLTAI